MSNISISCKDIYGGIDAEMQNQGYLVKAAWNTKALLLCNNIVGLEFVCNHLSVMEGELKKYGLTVDDVKPYCSELVKQCKPTFCSDGKDEANLEVTCDQLTTLVKKALANKDLQDQLKKKGVPINSIDDICPILGAVVGNDPENISKLDAIMQTFGSSYKELYDKYKANIPIAIKCICPDMKPNPDPGPDPEPSQQDDEKKVVKYHLLPIMIVVVALFVIGLTPAIFILISDSSFRGKIAAIGTMILLTIAITILIVEINYKTFFLSEAISGEDWVPVEGRYKGSGGIAGTNVDVDMVFSKNNTITFNVLKCTGHCPQEDLLGLCKEHTANINMKKTPNGYRLKGPCIDEIKKIDSYDVKTVKNIWVVRDGGTVKIQIEVEPCLSASICLEKVILLVPLEKVGDASHMIYGNPGCSVEEQSVCTAQGRGGSCGGDCCPCDDYEGEGCVPKSCAKSACRSGKCN